MACSCGKGTATASKTYTVKAPDGSTKTYRSEIEARAAAVRVGGTFKAAG